jgi:hypothetical protein
MADCGDYSRKTLAEIQSRKYGILFFSIFRFIKKFINFLRLCGFARVLILGTASDLIAGTIRLQDILCTLWDGFLTPRLNRKTRCAPFPSDIRDLQAIRPP